MNLLVIEYLALRQMGWFDLTMEEYETCWPVGQVNRSANGDPVGRKALETRRYDVHPLPVVELIVVAARQRQQLVERVLLAALGTARLVQAGHFVATLRTKHFRTRRTVIARHALGVVLTPNQRRAGQPDRQPRRGKLAGSSPR